MVRLGAAKVMSRQGYATLAGAFSLDSTNKKGTYGGNPDLKPYLAWQYNLGVEWYYAPQALASLGLFDMQIENFVTSQRSLMSITLRNSCRPFMMRIRFLTRILALSFDITKPVNGGKGTDKGYEFNVQQPVGNGFGFIFNYTYSDAKKANGQQIDGNSKNTANLTGYYENAKISTRLAYNYRSKFISGTDRGASMWQDDYGTLDGSFSYNLNDHIALTLDAQNLLPRKALLLRRHAGLPARHLRQRASFYWVPASNTEFSKAYRGAVLTGPAPPPEPLNRPVSSPPGLFFCGFRSAGRRPGAIRRRAATARPAAILRPRSLFLAGGAAVVSGVSRTGAMACGGGSHGFRGQAIAGRAGDGGRAGGVDRTAEIGLKLARAGKIGAGASRRPGNR